MFHYQNRILGYRIPIMMGCERVALYNGHPYISKTVFLSHFTADHAGPFI